MSRPIVNVYIVQQSYHIRSFGISILGLLAYRLFWLWGSRAYLRHVEEWRWYLFSTLQLSKAIVKENLDWPVFLYILPHFFKSYMLLWSKWSLSEPQKGPKKCPRKKIGLAGHIGEYFPCLRGNMSLSKIWNRGAPQFAYPNGLNSTFNYIGPTFTDHKETKKKYACKMAP